MEKILAGIRVIDWSQWHAGPEGAALLGDLGADVYHVEQKGVGDQYRSVVSAAGIPAVLPQGPHILFESLNRNKRGLALDLQKPSGREIMNRLVKNCDVFLTSAETDTITRFGLDYATLSQINPRLIYAWLTPFGDKGPDANIAGFDPLFQARSGIMASSGDQSEPRPVVTFLLDEMTGVILQNAVLVAPLARERYGFGQEVRRSGLASGMQLMQQLINVYLLTGREIPDNPRQRPHIATFNHYKCKGGAWIMIAAHREMDWGPLCRALDMPELETNPEYDTMMKRLSKAPELVKLLDKVFAGKTRPEWLHQLRKAHVAYAPVNTITDLASDPQVIENNYLTNYDHPLLGGIKTFGFPWQFSKTPAVRSRPAPGQGQHNKEILMEVCGYTRDDIRRFEEEEAT